MAEKTNSTPQAIRKRKTIKRDGGIRGKLARARETERERERISRQPQEVAKRQQQAQQEAQQRQVQQRKEKFQTEISKLESQIKDVEIQEAKLRISRKTDAGLERKGRSLRTQLDVLNKSMRGGFTFESSSEQAKAQAQFQARVISGSRGAEQTFSQLRKEIGVTKTEAIKRGESVTLSQLDIQKLSPVSKLALGVERVSPTERVSSQFISRLEAGERMSVPPEFPSQQISVAPKEPSKFKKVVGFFDTSGLSEARARISVRGEGKFQEGTQQFETEVQRQTQKIASGTQLQSAFFLSLAGVRTIPKPQTTFFGTAEQVPSGTRIQVLGETVGDGRSIFSISQEIVKAEGKQVISGSRGVTFKAEDIITPPSVKPVTKLTEIDPFFSVGFGEKIGKAKVIKQIDDFKVAEEIGRGTIIRSRTITGAGEERNILGLISKTSPRKPDVTFQFGGKPKLIVSKEGVKLRVEDIDIRGFIFKVPAKVKDEKVGLLKPTPIKKTPLGLTFQEQEAVSRAVASIKKAGEVSLRRSGGLISDGKLAVLPGVSTGIIGGQFTRDTFDSLSGGFVQGVSTSIFKQIGKTKAEEEALAERIKEKLKQKPKIKTAPKIIEVSLLGQPQPQIQTEAQKQFLRQFGLLKTVQLEKQIVKEIVKPTPTLKPKAPVVPKVSEVQRSAIRKALKKFKDEGVNVISGIRKPKIIFMNLPPRLALKKAQARVDQNLLQSFRLVKSGKKPTRKDIKDLILSGKFRSAKTNPLFMTEKKAYILDTPREKKLFKLARQKAKKKTGRKKK